MLVLLAFGGRGSLVHFYGNDRSSAAGVAPAPPPGTPWGVATGSAGACDCNNNPGPSHTLLSPAAVDPLSPRQCFNARAPGLGLPALRENPPGRCAFSPAADWTEVDIRDYSRERTFECLAKPRGGAHPRNMMFVLGDSHAFETYVGIEAAVGERMAIGMAAYSGWAAGEGDAEWVGAWLDALRQEVRRGDVVAILGRLYHEAPWNRFSQTPSQDAWLEEHLLEPVLKPAGAKLVWISDNLELSRPPYTCSRDLSRCAPLAATRALHAQREAELAAFAARHPGVVYVFAQSGLWRDTAAVPGTLTPATFDHSHLSKEGALYLTPYLCGAFERWGFFDGETRPAVSSVRSFGARVPA